MEKPIIIGEPGLYTISSQLYHSDPVIDPSLTSSIGKLMLNKSPAHAKQEHPRLADELIVKEKSQFDLGSAAHAMLLHEDLGFAVHDGDNWQGNVQGIKSAEWKRRARARGQIPILSSQLETTEKMVQRCRDQLPEAEAKDAFDMEAGSTERTIVWKEGSVWCRCKLDWLPNEVNHGSVFYDYKTTQASAHPDAWEKTGYGMGIDIQSSFYRRAIRSHFGVRKPRLRFLVQENYPPYEMCCVELTEAAQAFADRKVDSMIEMWRQCIDQGVWPGYPARVAWISPPKWLEEQWLEREEREPMDENMVRRMIDWQSSE